jgi:hypothetical protein
MHKPGRRVRKLNSVRLEKHINDFHGQLAEQISGRTETVTATAIHPEGAAGLRAKAKIK